MSVARTVYCFGIPPLIVGTLERVPTPGTSESSSLRIAAVTPGERHGRIGITLCPGKTDPVGLTGPWARGLDTDLDAVQRWGASAVVSLITDAEFDLLSVRDLPGAVRDRHMEWWHVPIPDGRPPGPDFEDACAVAGEAVRDRLSLGFDVLVHCRGGLGRAGTVAARLLVELGASPDDAIRRVREARSTLAIETTSQEAHVARCSARAPSAPLRTAAAIRDRAHGAFLGLATGDAVGTTLEFRPRDAQPLLKDMTGGGPFALPAGAWTDDTAMALALADSLAASGSLDCRDLMNRFVAWLVAERRVLVHGHLFRYRQCHPRRARPVLADRRPACRFDRSAFRGQRLADAACSGRPPLLERPVRSRSEGR